MYGNYVAWFTEEGLRSINSIFKLVLSYIYKAQFTKSCHEVAFTFTLDLLFIVYVYVAIASQDIRICQLTYGGFADRALVLRVVYPFLDTLKAELMTAPVKSTLPLSLKFFEANHASL